MTPTTTPSVHHALVFVVSVLLGLWLRGEQVAHAWGKSCTLVTGAQLIEVRRVEGNGDIAVEEMSWEGELSLDAGRIIHDRPAPFFDQHETFLIELEEDP